MLSQPLLEVETAENRAVVRLNATVLNDTNVPLIGEQLTRLVEASERQHWCLDLERVEYISSVGLARFIGLHKKLKGRGGHLTLDNVGPVVHDAFRVTQLDKLLDIRTK